ncbi:MAG: hypothetical protein LKE36_06790 [Bacilli bacterium]|jgi:hypothetical protein|nr:hypothetical protein [Bacilli bacterium]
MDQKSKIFFLLLVIIGAAILIGATVVYFSLYKKEQKKIDDGVLDKEIIEGKCLKRKSQKQ